MKKKKKNKNYGNTKEKGKDLLREGGEGKEIVHVTTLLTLAVQRGPPRFRNTEQARNIRIGGVRRPILKPGTKHRGGGGDG